MTRNFRKIIFTIDEVTKQPAIPKQSVLSNSDLLHSYLLVPAGERRGGESPEACFLMPQHADGVWHRHVFDRTSGKGTRFYSFQTVVKHHYSQALAPVERVFLDPP